MRARHLLIALTITACFQSTEGDGGGTEGQDEGSTSTSTTVGTSTSASTSGAVTVTTTATSLTTTTLTGSLTDALTDTLTATDTATTDTSGSSTTGTAEKCDDYCSSIMDACNGPNQQYDTVLVCEGFCPAIPPGRTGASTGNNLECRLTQAFNAGESPDTSCTDAGPTGASTCGSNCGTFCDLHELICTGDLAQWQSFGECMAACEAFPGAEVNYGGIAPNANTFACRMKHLTYAPVEPNVHCPHLAVASSVCKDPL